MPASMRSKGFQAKMARSKHGLKNSYVGIDLLDDAKDDVVEHEPDM